VNDGDDANEMTGCSLEDDGDYLSFYYHEHYPTCWRSWYLQKLKV